ncbi:MAG: YfiR family protein [Verrucomicrobiota bacterium]
MTAKPHMLPVANQVLSRTRILLLWLGIFMAGTLQAQPPDAPEYNLKAGYLIRFVKYISWPTNTFASSNAPIVIGVMGANPFGDVLEKTAKAEQGGRPLVVRRMDNIADAMQCHVVFISQAEEGKEARWLAALKDKPILTVGESAQTLERGGILQFVTDGKRLRFEASLPASQFAGLKLDADLLSNARGCPCPEGVP